MAIGFDSAHHVFAATLVDAERAVHSGQLRELVERVSVQVRESRPGSEEQVCYEFAQLLVGLVGLESALLRHELNEAGDWICWSLSTEIVDGARQELEVGRLGHFIGPVTGSSPPFPLVLLTWIDHFFYYARARSAMADIAQHVLPVAMRLLEHLWPTATTPGVAKAAANILAWSVQELPEVAPQLVHMLEVLAEDRDADGRARLIAAITLGGRPGDLSSAGRQHWRTLALTDLTEWHRAHERLQLLVDELGVRGDPAFFEEVVREIDHHQAWMANYDSTDVEVQRGVEAHSIFLQVALHACLERRQPERIVTLLAHWYRIPSTEVVEPDSLLVHAPFCNEGAVALLGDASDYASGDPQALLIALTDASNRFLGAFTSVSGNSGERPYQPERPGTVDPAQAPAFEELLGRVYAPPFLDGRRFSRLLVIPSKAHPVQAVQLRRTGLSAPFAASFRRPYADRTVRRVAIWSGAGSITEELERCLVAAVFRAAGAQVEVVAPHEASVERFSNLYEDADFDVVWLMSHGIFDHYAPKTATVMIDSTEAQIGISDLLARAPIGPGRRLLVLNVCDGARFEELGVLPRAGLGPAVASPAQATISHLWPIQPLAAAAFGALLAHHLAQSMTYYEAFAQTVRTLHDGAAGVVAVLRSTGLAEAEALIERVGNTSLDFQNLAFSGSGAFYE